MSEIVSLSEPKQETGVQEYAKHPFFWQCYGAPRYKATKTTRTTLRLRLDRLSSANYKLSVALSIDVHGLLQI